MGHIAGKGVTWRRVALTKDAGKTQKMGGGEGNLLENCRRVKKRKKHGKKGERKEKGGKGRKREKVGPAGLLHDTANVVGMMPAMSRPPLHKKRPCSNSLGKTQKCGTEQEKCKFEQSEHWFVTTNRPKWHLHRPTRPKKNTTNTLQKNDSLMSKIDQKRVLNFRKVRASKN